MPLELRLDLFASIDLEQIRSVISHHPHPVLLTLKKSPHQSEEEHVARIRALLALSPAFFDLEYGMDPATLSSLLSSHPHTQFILSYHSQSPLSNLEEIYQNMSKYPASIYKIAALCDTASQALAMLLFSRKHPKVSTICMGERVSFARILAPIFGSIQYTFLSKQTAPGQIPLQTLLQTYRYPTLSPKTKIYGLIGDPVTNSQGHIYHNNLFSQKNIDAVYVKIPLTPPELPTFLPLAEQAGFKGLSVTMPLKEAVTSFLQNKQNPANTLLFHENNLYGANTDGLGAIAALEEITPLQGKTLVILGCGGSAKAIALAASQKGAKLIILNKTLSKAKKLAESLNASFGPLHSLPPCDILINTTPYPMPINPLFLTPKTLVMDISYPKDSLLLQYAKKLNCPILNGQSMFERQALAQHDLWTSLSYLQLIHNQV
jgi:3-dehydroquinate dehydratase/shikimate dehydrogenase